MGRIQPINEQSLALAKQIIDDGGLIVVPTDTVYGIACNPYNAQAIARIYEAKGRPSYKALQVLFAHIEDIDQAGLDLPSPLNRLAATFLPGGLSPIAVAREDCNLKTLSVNPSGIRTQGIRVPNSAALRSILELTGPLAASSANKSGETSAQSAQEAFESLGDAVDLILDAGATVGHVASTVVAADPLMRDGIHIIREGAILEKHLRFALHMNGGGLGA